MLSKILTSGNEIRVYHEITNGRGAIRSTFRDDPATDQDVEEALAFMREQVPEKARIRFVEGMDSPEEAKAKSDAFLYGGSQN